MAVIHKSKTGTRRRRRAAGALTLLCWPLAALAALLTVLFYLECGAGVIAQAESWRDAFLAWALATDGGTPAAQDWTAALEKVLVTLVHGTAWCIYGVTAAVPGLLGATAAMLLACLQRPCRKRWQTLRAQVRLERAAMGLLRQLPDACHLFLHPRLVFDGGTSEMDVVIAGPGGTAVLDVKNWSGLIEGCVTESVLYRKRPDGEVEKLRNPARQVVGHVTRLSNYLRSVNVPAGVVPCVLFVNPEASVYVRTPEETIISGRRSRISSCIMADTTNFWELLGRELGGGRVLNRFSVEQVAAAITKAPQGRRTRR